MHFNLILANFGLILAIFTCFFAALHRFWPLFLTTAINCQDADF